MKKTLILLFALMFASALLFAGGKQEATKSGGKIGGTVSVLTVWGGSELEIFNNMIKPFEEQTGIKVEHQGTRDISAVLTTRIKAGNPPDIAGLPGPGQMIQFAKEGKLVDLGQFLDMARMKKDYAESWIDLGSVNGKLVGIFLKAAVKGPIWYNPKAIKAVGITLPKTWDELMTVSKKLASQGKTPWSIGLESGAASGWAGTDWLEDIVLRTAGPQKYMDWYKGKLAWTSPEIKKAWQMWGEIVANDRMVYGGRQYVLSTNFGQAAGPLFENPPKAYFHHQATFIQSFILKQFPNLKPVEDFNFFGFPEINPKYGKAVEAAGDLFGMFNDTPQARALMEYLTTAEAQSYWVKASNGISPNRSVPLSDYPDPLTKNAAEILTGADIVAFDASDMMPSAMNQAFWSAVMSYVQNPSKLDSILEGLEKVRKTAY
ncbi:MAG: carbohydrate ABC transporter substrate-binding protein [Spirochaetales bacterium]|nr:carbohydrate ABC transporter substrate-binding protein [Spirochaetales bacterium]